MHAGCKSLGYTVTVFRVLKCRNLLLEDPSHKLCSCSPSISLAPGMGPPPPGKMTATVSENCILLCPIPSQWSTGACRFLAQARRSEGPNKVARSYGFFKWDSAKSCKKRRLKQRVAPTFKCVTAAWLVGSGGCAHPNVRGLEGRR